MDIFSSFMKWIPSCLLVGLLLSVVAAQTDYCGFSSQHILCNNTDGSNVDQATCGTIRSSGVPESDIPKILQEHNNIRNSVAQGNEGQPKASNMMQMEWDDELAVMAQAWANTCIYGVITCINCRRLDRFSVGQNLYASYASPGSFVASWDKAVGRWKNGITNFDTSTVGSYVFSSSSAAYTQLVWGKTSKVGCGLMVIVDGDWDKGTYVCLYGPAGNVGGVAVYDEGEACTSCPSDTQCSSTYTGLCSSGNSTTSTNNNESPDNGNPENPQTEPGSENQCSSDYCSFTEEHTLCKHPQGSINAANCGDPLDRLVSSAQRTTILNEHNKWRSWVAEGNETEQPGASNMMQMVWDEELAVVAQALTDQCVFAHDCNACRRVKRFGVGQNLYMSYTTGSIYTTNWAAAVTSWYSEVGVFNSSYIEPFTFTYDTGHYTQVVWANTWKVGCGFTSYISGSRKYGLYACNYGPGGNIGGQAMYQEGASCSSCPVDTQCSDEYDGLCQSTLPDECAATNSTTGGESTPTTTNSTTGGESTPTTTTSTTGGESNTSMIKKCKPMIIRGPTPLGLELRRKRRNI